MSSDDITTQAAAGPRDGQTYLVDGQQRYRIAGRLGGGGFGVVFKAWHEQTASWVAIKRLSVAGADAAALMKEATRLGQVDSDYLAKPRACFYDDQQSLCYLVTDLASEGDLRHYLQTRPTPLPVGEALELTLGIARGLAALHACDILHRDIKPANVLMYRRDERIVPRLGDFGFARRQESLSLTDCVSPGYASPEQIAFERGGEESDLFSFGLVIYELLTGAPAADGQGLEAYAAWVATLRARPLPQVSSCRPELASWLGLDALVGTLTSFDRTVRQRITAADLVQEIEAILRREPVPARAMVLPRVPSPAKSTSTPLRAAVVVALAFVAAFIGWWLVRVSLEPGRSEPVSPLLVQGETPQLPSLAVDRQLPVQDQRAVVAPTPSSTPLVSVPTEVASARTPASSPQDVRPAEVVTGSQPQGQAVEPPPLSVAPSGSAVSAPGAAGNTTASTAVTAASTTPATVSNPVRDRGRVISMDGPVFTDSPLRTENGRVAPLSWAIGTFSGGNCFDREAICTLEIKGAGDVSLAVRNRIADMNQGTWRVSGELRYRCTFAPSFEQIACQLDRGRVATFDLSPTTAGGVRMTKADRTSWVELARSR